MRNRHITIDRWVTLGLIAYSLGLAAAIVLVGARVTYDDGFYYFTIAQHVARGAGSTFDGMHPTNGYHPLWLLSLVPIFWLAPASEAALRWGTALQGALLAADVALLYQIARLTLGRLAAGLAALLWVAWTYRLAVSGLEYGLHALGVLAAAYAYLRWFDGAPPRPRAYLALGLLLSMTFLARLDTIALAAAIGLALAWRERRGVGPGAPARLHAFAAPLIVAVLAYAGANLWLFGTALPVSGLVKRAWSADLLARDPLFQTSGALVAKIANVFWPFGDLRANLANLALDGANGVALGSAFYSFYIILGSFGVAAIYGVAALSAPHPPAPSPTRGEGERKLPFPPLWGKGLGDGGRRTWLHRTFRPWAPFIFYSLAQLIGYALIYHAGLSSTTWYYVTQPFLASLLIAAVVDRLVSGLRAGRRSHWASRLLGPIAVAGWLCLPLYPLWGLKQSQDALRQGFARQPSYDTAQWARDNLPDDAVIGAWNAGTIGYLSGRRVVNLDGLVNSWDYARLKRYDLCDYWRESGITHLADSFANRRAISVVPMYPAYAACADRLRLLWGEDRASDAAGAAVFQIVPHAAAAGP